MSLNVNSENQLSNNITPQQNASKVSKKEGRSFVVVDIKEGAIKLTSNAEQASSPKDIHTFVMKHEEMLTPEQKNIMLKTKLKNNNIIRLENSKMPSAFKKSLLKIEKI